MGKEKEKVTVEGTLYEYSSDETLYTVTEGFLFEEKSRSSKKLSELLHDSEYYDYEQYANELMARHYDYYQQIKDIDYEYVLRGAVLTCTHGNKETRLDALEDHGVYFRNQPVMTCKDCKLEENIFSFGACGNAKYQPVYSDVAPQPADKELDSDGKECSKCIPILLREWGYGDNDDRYTLLIRNDAASNVYASDTEDERKQCSSFKSQIKELNKEKDEEEIEELIDGYDQALMTCDNLLCLYGGVITIVENPETEEEMGLEEEVEPEEIVIEENENIAMMLVTLEELDQFGFYMGKSEEERKAGLETLNTVLNEYGITTDKQIAYFMGQVARESGKGIRTLEQFSLNSEVTTPEEYFNKIYKNRNGNKKEGDGELYRGGGYIHLTGRYNYEAFAKAMGEKYGAEEEEAIISQGYRMVGGTYNKNVNDIAKNEKGVVDVGKYAWEASAWFWVEGNPDGVNLNKYVDADDWSSVSEAINRMEQGTKGERNKYINEFYEIRTGEQLGLPENVK